MVTSECERKLLWNIYCELGLMERNLGGLQARYRALASTWLLATLAAIGFVLTKELDVAVPDELIIGALGIGGSIGILLLWAVDLLVYQRLLDGAYIEGRSLEDAQPWLPQVRNNIRRLLGGEGMALLAWFYIVPTVLLAAIGGVGVLIWSFQRVPLIVGTVVAVLYYAALILVAWLMLKRTSKTPVYGRDLFCERRDQYLALRDAEPPGMQGEA